MIVYIYMYIYIYIYTQCNVSGYDINTSHGYGPIYFHMKFVFHSHRIYEWWFDSNGPLTGYIKLRVAHAPGMPEIFSPTLRVNDPDMRRGTCMTHVPRCMPGSLNSCYIWRRRRGKRSRHSRRMRNQQFYVSGIYNSQTLTVNVTILSDMLKSIDVIYIGVNCMVLTMIKFPS